MASEHRSALPLTTTTAARPRRIALPGSVRPAEMIAAMAQDPYPVALSGDWCEQPSSGAWGEDVDRTATAATASRGALTILTSEPMALAPAGVDPLVLLDELPEAGQNPEGVLVGGGWIGWLGYGLGAQIEAGVLGPPPPVALVAPLYSLAFYDHVLVHDGAQWWFEMLETSARSEVLTATCERWRQRLAGRPEPRNAVRRMGLNENDARSAAPGPELSLVGSGAVGHMAAVAACGERIAAGDLYQANLCLGLAGEWHGDGMTLLARALESIRPRFGAAVGGVVSLSPERFLRRIGTTVWSEPIKGTRPRIGSDDDAADAASRAELAASAKDAAEHVMIVDLMRNDLGRVCEYGSVTAQRRRLEPHSGVWQMVSTVSGQLAPRVTNGQLLRATFPPGSVTGAPKIAAMQLISELESTRREAYTGAIGIVSPIAGLDLAVAIRTFELTPGRIWLGVGGGIVADSDPAAELAEALVKANGTLVAVGGHVVAGGDSAAGGHGRAERRRGSPGPVRRALDLSSRPDPDEGVFETLLAVNGRPQLLTAHLKRLSASVAQLYGHTLPEDLGTRVSVTGAGLSRARVRILVRADGTVEIEANPEPIPVQDAPALALAPWLLPGGLGAHKWIDRRLIAALEAAERATVPLLVDGDGAVLEAGYANVWIVEAGEWITPPADGRILPGVTRSLLLANPTVPTREASFDLARLKAADRVFLSSSISGRRLAVLADD